MVAEQSIVLYPFPSRARPLQLCWLATKGTQEPVAFRRGYPAKDSANREKYKINRIYFYFQDAAYLRAKLKDTTISPTIRCF